MEMKEWNLINRGDKTALDMPVLITNIWIMVLRLHVRSRNLNKAKNTLPLFERSEIGQEKIYYYTVSTLLFFFAK